MLVYGIGEFEIELLSRMGKQDFSFLLYLEYGINKIIKTFIFIQIVGSN